MQILTVEMKRNERFRLNAEERLKHEIRQFNLLRLLMSSLAQPLN